MPYIPTIHLNGSDPIKLRDSYLDAAQALVKLANALAVAAPHGRDYYPQGPDAFNHAQNEHRGRLAALDRLRIDYLEIIQGIQRQIDAHKVSR